jgi:Tfp pilus assembly PilM family ATPase
LARFLAIDWDHNQIHVVLADVSRRGVKIERAVVWSEETPLSLENAEAVGQRLRQRLNEAKIAPASVIAAIGRERLIVKDLRFPIVAPHEEAELVRFQAQKDLTQTPGEVLIDYTPIGDTGNERRALVFIARKEHANAYQAMCKAAGLKLVGISPRSLGSPVCLERIAGTTVLTPEPEPEGATVAIVTVTERWAEFCVAREGTLLMARGLNTGAGLVGDVRRNVAVWSGQAAGQPIRAIYVAGGPDNAGLRQRLAESLDLNVHLLDPFAGGEVPDAPAPDTRGGFAGLFGLLHLQGSRTGLPCNFAKPREYKPPTDRRIRWAVLGGALAASLLVLGVAYFIYAQSTLNRQVAGLNQRISDLDKDLAAQGEEAKKAKAVGDWNDKGIVLLDEFYDFSERFPEYGKARLNRFSVNSVDLAANAKDKQPLGRMTFLGVTKEDRPVNDLTSKYFEDSHYRVSHSIELKKNTGPDAKQGYTQQFETKGIDVTKRKPDDYIRVITTPPPKEPSK